MSIERFMPAHFFDEDRLAALKTIAPEAFADGKINWATRAPMLTLNSHSGMLFFVLLSCHSGPL